MGSKLYLTLAAIAAIVYGLGFLLIPGPVVALYGGPIEPHVLLNAQFFGAALLGLGVIEWLAKDFRDKDAVRGVLIGAAIGDALVGLVNVSGSNSGCAERPFVVIDDPGHPAAGRRALLPGDQRAQGGLRARRLRSPAPAPPRPAPDRPGFICQLARAIAAGPGGKAWLRDASSCGNAGDGQA